VHGRQVGLRVRPDIARRVARAGAVSARLARIRFAGGQRHVLRSQRVAVTVAITVAIAAGVSQQLTSRLAPQRPRLLRRRTVYHRPVQIVSGLIHLWNINTMNG